MYLKLDIIAYYLVVENEIGPSDVHTTFLQLDFEKLPNFC